MFPKIDLAELNYVIRKRQSKWLPFSFATDKIINQTVVIGIERVAE
jgi:hypothetical protein